LILNVGKYVLGIGVLLAMVWWNWDPGNGKGLKDALSKPLHLGPLLIAAAAVTTGISLSFVRWYLLVRALDLPFRLYDAFRLGLLGSFCCMFLPGAVSGDVVRAAFLAREQQRRTAAAATALADRLVGMWGLFWLVALGGSAAWALGNQAIAGSRFLQLAVMTACGVVVVSLAVWLVAGLLSDRRAQWLAEHLERIPKVGGVLAELWRAGWMYRNRPGTVTVAILISLVNHVCLATAFFFCGHIFQDPGNPIPIPSLAEHFIFFPIGELIQVIPFLPGGVGLAEAGYAALYSLTGFSENTGMNVALIYRALLWCWALIGYYVYLRMRPSTMPSPQPASDLVMADL
jgi:uncharacterized protein (TIRG00374 family)